MAASPSVIAGLTRGLVALTPVERWQAAQRFSGSFVTERWFLIAVLVVMFTLGALLLVVSLYKTARELKTTENLFEEYAQKRGLGEHESKLLLVAATKAGLGQAEAIFTMSAAFDRGSDKMIEEHLKSQKSARQTRRLKKELAELRQKLGFRKRIASVATLPAQSRQISSRQIPVGKELHIATRGDEQADAEELKCTITRNTDNEFAVKPAAPLETQTGQSWTLKYDLGASLWEFEATVVSCADDTVVFNHSDNIRFISRRCFPRIPVQRRALIASFPFEKTVAAEEGPDRNAEIADSRQNQPTQAPAEISCRPPEFVDAVVTELGGPGLRIEALLNVKVGDRVLIVFHLGEKETAGHAANTNNMKILQDVGVVRDVTEVGNARDRKGIHSIAVELVTLNESDLDELVRITNAAAVKAEHRTADAQESENTEHPTPQTVGTQEG